MTNPDLLCDGCGQPASSEHIAKRLQRLEWTTRYRPIHIGTLLLGACAPADDAEFLYAERDEFLGEAKKVLDACGLVTAGKSWQAVLTEFQRAGFLLTYALECPLDPRINEEVAISTLLASRMPALLARIRRSLKPKRIVPISLTLGPLLTSIREVDTGCPVLLDDGKPFDRDGRGGEETAARLRRALSAAASLGK